MSQGEATHGHRGDRNKPITRRRFLTALGTLAGSAVLAACATPTPQVIEKIVKETVVVKETVAVEKSVEKVVTATPVPKKPQTLMLWGASRFKGKRGNEPGGKDTDWWDWQVELFQAQYPWLTLKYELNTANAATAIAAGDWPNVQFSSEGAMWTYAPQNIIAPVNDYTPKAVLDNWVDSHKNAFTYVDGKIYGFPMEIAVGGGLMLNMTMAKKNNALDLAPVSTDPAKNPTRDWTMDQAIEYLKANTVAADGTYGTAWMTDWAYQVDQFLYSHGARQVDQWQSEFTFNSAEGIKGLQWLVDTEHKYKVAAPGSSGRTQDIALKMFVEGKTAMIPSQSAYIGIFRRTDGTAPDFKWAFVPPPHDEGHTAASYLNHHTWYAFNFKDPDKLEASMLLGNFLAREEAVEVHCRARGYIPPLKSLENMHGTDPDFLASVNLARKGAVVGCRVGEVQTEALVPMYDKAFLQKMTPKEALDEAKTKADKLLADAATKFKWPKPPGK